MTFKELEALCHKHAEGNVSAFCKALGVSRFTYYRQKKAPAVSALVELRVRDRLEKHNARQD